MTNLPPPMTPPRSDLKDFGYMPLEIVRFRGSDLLSEDAEVIVAALMLWTAAWQETPAASLKDDDKALARAAGFGRSVAGWLEVKEGALRGFVKCSDGRLYHPVVARLANEAWKSKVEQRWRAEVARRKKWNERHPDDLLAAISFEAFAAVYPGKCPDDKATMSQGHLPLVPTTGAENGGDIGSKGESRESKVKGDSTATIPREPAPVDKRGDRPEDLLAITNRIATLAGVSVIQPAKLAREMDIVKGWIAKGISVEGTILPAIEKRLGALPKDETVGGLAYFDAAILKAHNANGKRSSPVEKPEDMTERDDDDPRIEDMRARLKRQLGPRTYDGWLRQGVTAISVNGTSTTIKASSRFLADWISSNLSDKLRAAIAEAGLPPDIRISA